VLSRGAVAAEALDEGFEIAQAQNAQMLALRNVASRLDMGLPLASDQAAVMAEKIAHVSDCKARRKVMDALAI